VWSGSWTSDFLTLPFTSNLRPPFLISPSITPAARSRARCPFFGGSSDSTVFLSGMRVSSWNLLKQGDLRTMSHMAVGDVGEVLTVRGSSFSAGGGENGPPP